VRRFTQDDLQAETIAATTGGHETRIAVLPRMGANLVSLQVDGREFIHFDREILFAAEPHMTGCFHMFPTPCRLGNSSYCFGGREIVQQKRGEKVQIHGLTRDEPFEIEKSERELIATLDFGERHPVYEGFPFPGRITIRYQLIARGVEATFSYENRGDADAPAGYGVHPFWQIPADRADVLVKVPADHRLEQDDPASQLPTGALIPVAGTQYDLRDYRSLADLFIDDVYYPRPEREQAGIVFASEKLRLNLEGSPNMRHLICYSPQGRQFVCVENLTCSPDAPNLYAKGYPDISGLTIVRPGEKLEARVRYRVEEV